jgi:hypothetical protein
MKQLFISNALMRILHWGDGVRMAEVIATAKGSAMTKRDAHPHDLEMAFLDPASSFSRPEDVLSRRGLRLRDKIEILCRWAYDATELAVAEEEGMFGGEPSDLSGVVRALDAVTGGFDVEQTGPTKHRGFCVR